MTQTLAPGTRGSDIPHPVDIHVGQRIKQRRTLLGMTQGKLGDAINLTFQQIQKYERGANRVSCSKIWQLSNVLDVPVSWFFEEMPNAVKDMHPGYEGETSESDTPEEYLPLYRRQSLELVRTFGKVQDPTIRKRIIDVTRAIAESSTINTHLAQAGE